MALYRADTAYVGWGKETSGYAVAVSANISGSFGIMEGFEPPDPKIDWIAHRNIGSNRDLFIQVEGKHTVEGKISVYPQDFELLEFAFGTLVSGNPTDGFHTGVGSPDELVPIKYTLASDGTIPSMTIRTAYDTGSTMTRQFTGMKVDKLTMTAEEEGLLKMEMDLKGSKAERLDGVSYTGGNDIWKTPPFIFYGGQFKMWGSSFAKVTSFEFTMNNNLKPKHYIASGGQYAQDMVEGVRDFDLSVTIVADSDDDLIYDHFLLSQTISGFSVVLGLDCPGCGDASRAVDIEAVGCVITEAPYKIPDDRAEIPVELKIKPKTVNVYEFLASSTAGAVGKALP